MNLHWLDWVIIIAVLGALIGITVFAKRYNRSVSDFLAANRLAGRYLLTVSSGFGGAISLIAVWQMTYHNGLPAQWWGLMAIPLGLFVSLTGFVVYRFRETRALTLAQFFEMRYSRSFRLFSGFICWLSGILNYGIFPAVTARFIIYFFGFPEAVSIFGIHIGTFPLVMFVYLGIAVYIACAGGQISIMLTDFFQGMLLLIIFLVVMFFLLSFFGWGDIIEGLRNTPPGKSLINPFETAQAEDFNIWYFLIGVLGTLYGVRSWQGNSGYNSAAKTPHEAVMSGIIGSWRGFASGLCMVLIPLSAYAAMHSAKFATMVAPVRQHIAAIADPAVADQMTVPLFLAEVLPTGLLGLFAVVVIACAISCDDTYIHAWGTIFIQDVVMPFRKKPFEAKQHMFILRCAIIGVALFGFIFSMTFQLKDFILMYFAVTGAIYTGGAGAVIIGGLYWRRGSTPAAWTAIITGSTIGIAGIVIEQYWKTGIDPFLLRQFPKCAWLAAHAEKFPVNGQYINLITMLSSVFAYVSISLLGPKHVHNFDKLFHRGKFADGDSEFKVGPKTDKKFSFHSLIGITSDFTLFDKVIAWSSFTWSMGWWVIFLAVTGLAVFTTWLTTNFWVEFWWWKLIPFSILLGTVCTIWISVGGIKDAITLIQDLRKERVNDADNGFVTDSEKDSK